MRQPTDTIKGQMYHDIGVSDWTCEVDQTTGADLWSRLKLVHSNPVAARAHVREVMARIATIQRRMVEVARTAIAAG